MKNTTTLCALALAATVSAANASTIINPNVPTSNVAANAGSSLSFLVGGTDDFGGSSLTYDGGATTLATGTDASVALATTHALDSVDGSYVTATNGSAYFDAGTAPVFTFTLDQVYDQVDSIFLWNYTHDNEVNQAKDFTVTFYDTDDAIIGSSYVGQMVERAGSATVVDAEQFIFSSSYDGVSYFTLELTSNWSGNRVGLGEVRLTQIPEPSQAALLAGMLVCGMALVRRRGV